jgi:hypothetical protein
VSGLKGAKGKICSLSDSNPGPYARKAASLPIGPRLPLGEMRFINVFALDYVCVFLSIICMCDWMDGWVDGWMGGWMDGWVDGWMDGLCVCCSIYVCNLCWSVCVLYYVCDFRCVYMVFVVIVMLFCVICVWGKKPQAAIFIHLQRNDTSKVGKVHVIRIQFATKVRASWHFGMAHMEGETRYH